MTGIARTGRETAQKQHSSSRSQAAATKIFNDPLNLTGKANRPRRIAPSSATIIGQPSPAAAKTRNSSEYLANAPFCFGSLVFPRSLAFFIRRVSLFRYSPSRSKYIYLYPENIYISLGGVLSIRRLHSHSPILSPYSPPPLPPLSLSRCCRPPTKRKAPGVLSLDALSLVTACPGWPQ